MRAAAAALPFEHPKLAVVAQVSENDLAERLMQAIQARAKIINARPMQFQIFITAKLHQRTWNRSASKPSSKLCQSIFIVHALLFAQTPYNSSTEFRRF